MRRRRPGVTPAPTTAALAPGDGPGVTAAPTTAALATGEGPGRTAAVTTAALATGAPTTPTRPTRPRLRGMSASYWFEIGVVCARRDDGLDRDAAVGDELPARATGRRCERCRPGVLVHQDARDAAGVHGCGEVFDILLRQELGQLRLEDLQGAELVEVFELHDLDSAVLILDEHEDVDDPDGAGVGQVDQLLRHLAGEVSGSRWELDDDEVDRPELIEWGVGHVGFVPSLVYED